jgi:hypothetical protein
MDLFSSFERRGEPLAPRWLFARRLVINVGLALALIGVSLLAGMVGYHYFERAGWVDAFDQAAMIIGGMGPYSEPKSDGGKLFAGFYDRGRRVDLGASIPSSDAPFPPARRGEAEGERIRAATEDVSPAIANILNLKTGLFRTGLLPRGGAIDAGWFRKRKRQE